MTVLSNISDTTQVNESLLRDISKEEAEKLKNDPEERMVYVSGALSGHTDSSLPMEAYVKNGRILRVMPFHFPDDVRLYEIRTSKGAFIRPKKNVPHAYMLAYKKRAYSPNRVRYPLKRVDWSPTDRKTENRGESGFARITWDEALDIIEKEIKRIKDTYGLSSVLVQADGHGQSGWLHTLHMWGHYLFGKLGGGITQVRNPDSWEGYYWGAKHVWGFDGMGVGEPVQDAVWEDVLENCEMIIFTGCDPETTVPGFYGQIGTYMCSWMKKAGMKIIAISPDLNYAAAVHADKWVPIKPNTDAALYLAVAYVWIKEDTYDKKFIATHTHGFEDFERYVIGVEDGLPKTPEWAEKITGIPVETIKALARAWAGKRTSISVVYGGGKIRGQYCSEPARLEACVLSMQGLGKPGRQFVRFEISVTGMKVLPPVPRYPQVQAEGKPSNFVTALQTAPPKGRSFVIKTLVPDAILNPPVSWYCVGSIASPREDQFNKYTFPLEGSPEIHMIWDENSCYTACWNHGYKIIDAYRSPKIDFIVAIHPWLENDLLYADLILPAQTIFEHEDIVGIKFSDVPGLAYQDKCIDPIGESKSDYEIHRMVAQRLGVGEAFPEPEEALKTWAYEQSLAANSISWEEFKNKKLVLYDCPTPDEWNEIKEKYNVKPGLTWYYELPEGKGLETPTGKIEFKSTGLEKHFPDDKERPPLPHYIPWGESHQESVFHPRAEKYPLLMMSNHPRWRHHSMCDDITWIREIPTCKVRGADGYLYEPVWIHPTDAAKRGIKHGDVVKVYNERGTVLGAAYTTERIIPGAVYMDHGARHDLISIQDRIDRGGCINLISPPTRENTKPNTVVRVPEMAVSGFLVEVEKAEILELMEKYHDAFKRKMHSEVGPCFETWAQE